MNNNSTQAYNEFNLKIKDILTNYLDNNIDYDILVEIFSKLMRLCKNYNGKEFNNELGTIFAQNFYYIYKKYKLSYPARIRILSQLLADYSAYIDCKES